MTTAALNTNRAVIHGLNEVGIRVSIPVFVGQGLCYAAPAVAT
jgi:hypothetical protein